MKERIEKQIKELETAMEQHKSNFLYCQGAIEALKKLLEPEVVSAENGEQKLEKAK